MKNQKSDLGQFSLPSCDIKRWPKILLDIWLVSVEQSVLSFVKEILTLKITFRPVYPHFLPFSILLPNYKKKENIFTNHQSFFSISKRGISSVVAGLPRNLSVSESTFGGRPFEFLFIYTVVEIFVRFKIFRHACKLSAPLLQPLSAFALHLNYWFVHFEIK